MASKPTTTAPKTIPIILTVSRMILLFCIVVLALTLSSCKSEESTTAASEDLEPLATSGAQGRSTKPPEDQPTEPPASDDPEAILRAWQEGTHAHTFVVSADGENNSCSSCHSRYNYIPPIDDIPEECFACKFEVDDPEPFIPEKYWMHVDCMNCHRMDKKKVEPEIAWLEFALIEEYSEVASVTELCEKCHLAADITGHASVIVGGDHPNYQCTQCHDAHTTTANCSALGCHEAILVQDSTIAGHDEDHASVACVACHDADELEIGFIEELGLWTTLIATSEGGMETRPFTSHNIVLEAPCERCHFPGNPWGFSDTVETQ